MSIGPGSEVSIEYTLTLDNGDVVDSNVDGDPLTYTQGAGQLLPAFEKALEGLESGASKSVRLSAEDGYGEHNPELCQEVSPDQIPEQAREVGAMLVGQDASGNQRQVRISEVRDDAIVLDLNHPLAGESLNFQVRVISVG